MKIAFGNGFVPDGTKLILNEISIKIQGFSFSEIFLEV